MKISVLIPSWRRPASLARCLDGLERQARRPDQVIVSARADDEETRTILAERKAPFRLEIATPSRAGTIAALNSALELLDGDIVVFTDDDAAPYSDWLERIETRFAADPALGGLGGRDRMVTAEGVEREGPHDVTVGHIHWFGRVVGNHHLGSGPMRKVDILKGVNMSFRRGAVDGWKFDPALSGDGTEQHSEIGFCLALKASGWKLAYDPAILVDHYEEARYGSQRETRMSAADRHDALHNQVYSLLMHLPPLRRLTTFAYGVLVGTRKNPGLLLAVESILSGISPRTAAGRLRVTIAAHGAAVKTWRRRRHTARQESEPAASSR